MCLGALVSAGVPLEYLSKNLQKLGIAQDYRLSAQNVDHNGQLATKVHVELLGLEQPDHNLNHAHGHDHSHGSKYNHGHEHTSPFASNPQPQVSPHTPARHLLQIEQLITSASLSPRVTQWSLAIFRKLADAEGAVHGIAPEQVHFHEVGATDAIVDIVGTCLGLDWLGIDQLYCSALPTGGGTVRAAHGRLPVPVPAVLKLWESRQVPIYSNGIERELVTPTGAAIAVTLATRFGSPPPMTLQQVGLGAGSMQLPIPNILRLWIGQLATENWELGTGDKFSTPFPLSPHYPVSPSSSQSPALETISVLETQIDDLNPQVIGYVFEALFEVGALDVFTQSIGMKKSRPGVLLTVICHPPSVEACEAVLFRETTTLGVRRLTQQRAILQREIQRVQTEYGEVRVKVAWDHHSATESTKRSISKTITNVQPEYEDCANLARANNRSWREVHQLALQAWYRQYSS